MADNSKEARARAEARFEKAQKASQEREKVHGELEAEAKAVREKTARLRALRLAREADDAQAAQAAKAADAAAAAEKLRAAAKAKSDKLKAAAKATA